MRPRLCTLGPFLLSLVACAAPAPPRFDASFSETLLATIPSEIETREIAFSPDGRRAAFVARSFPGARSGGSARVWINGMPDKPFPDVKRDSLCFSPNGARVGYVAVTDGKQVAVVDGQAGPRFDEVRWVRFSRDGSRVAYAARADSRWFLVVDGVPGSDFAYVSDPVFSADGRTIACVAWRNGRQSVVMNGTPGPWFDSVDCVVSPVLSADGRRCAYKASQNSPAHPKGLVVADGEPRETDAGAIGFTEDGRHVGWSASRAGRVFAVIDGKEGPSSEGHAFPRPFVFSPDGRRTAFVAWHEGKYVVVVDGVRGKGFDEIPWPPVFSPDSARVAHVGFDAAQSPPCVVVGDGVRGEACDLAESPAFSPDSRHLGYLAIIGKKVALVVDGRRRGAWDMGQHVVFSDDSTRVACGVRQGRELWWKVVRID